MRYPKPLSDLMPDVLSGLGLSERLREAEIWRLWPEIVGQAIATQAQPLRIIGGTLTVAVSSGPWMQELTYLKGMMKNKLNDRLGGDVVKEIVLRSGRLTKVAEPVEERLLIRKNLTVQQKAEINKQAAVIVDPETREAFAALMRVSIETAK
jgi:hypothetical protein